MIKVAVGGGFDPLHQGHILHILKASMLGDYIYVLVGSDDDMIRKKGKCNIPLAWRVYIIKAVLSYLNIKGEVVPSLDNDGSSVETLRMLRPSIWAKGGDRTPDNMLQSEIDVCKEIGCEIIYGVGQQLNESSKMKL